MGSRPRIASMRGLGSALGEECSWVAPTSRPSCCFPQKETGYGKMRKLCRSNPQPCLAAIIAPLEADAKNPKQCLKPTDNHSGDLTVLTLTVKVVLNT